jgi:hypothetical protein
MAENISRRQFLKFLGYGAGLLNPTEDKLLTAVNVGSGQYAT